MDDRPPLEVISRRRNLWLEVFPSIKTGLFQLVYRVHGDHDLANEAVHHTSIAVYGACATAPALDSPSALSRYAFRVATNFALSHRRAQRRLVALDESVLWVDRDPRQALESRIVVEQLAPQLRPEDWRLLKLRYLEGLSIAEIGEIEGLDPRVISVRIHRAKARAREILEGGRPKRPAA